MKEPKQHRSARFADYVHAQLSREKDHMQSDLNAKLDRLRKIKRLEAMNALRNSSQGHQSHRGGTLRGSNSSVKFLIPNRSLAAGAGQLPIRFSAMSEISSVTSLARLGEIGN